MATETGLSLNSSPGDALQSWRTSTLNIILPVAAALGLPKAASIILQTVGEGRDWTAASVILVLSLLLVLLAALRRLDPRLRAWGLVLAGYAVAVSALVRGGMVGDGRIYLIGLPMVALVLAGVRSGLTSAILSLVLYVAFALLAEAGLLSDWLIVHDNPVGFWPWFEHGWALPVLGGFLLMLLWRFVASQEKALRVERQAAADMRVSSQRLRTHAQQLERQKRQLESYLQYLEASAEIGQAISQLLDLDELLDRTVELIESKFGFLQASIYLADEGEREARLVSSSGGASAEDMTATSTVELGSDCIVGRVISRATPCVLQDIRPEDYQDSETLLPGVRSAAALPLMARQRLLGALEIQSDTIDAFVPDLVAVLHIVTHQLAIAIENARTFTNEAAILEETSSYHRHSRAMSVATSQAKVKQALTDYLASTSMQFIQLLRPEIKPGELTPGLSEQIIWSTFGEPLEISTKDHPLASLVFRRELIHIDDTETEMPEHQVWPAPLSSLGSIAIIPLHRAGKWLGTLIIGSRKPFSFDIRLLNSFALIGSQALAALEHLRLYETAQWRAKREQSINAIIGQILASTTVQQVLDKTAKQVGQTLGATRVAVRLGSPEGNKNGRQG